MQRFPSYPKRAHSSNQARIKIDGRHVFLGVFGSPASWDEYQRRLTEWRERQANANQPAPDPKPSDALGSVRTVSDLVAAWWRAAQSEFRRADGSLRTELQNYRWSVKPFVRVCGTMHLRELKAGHLETMLKAMASGSWLTAEEKHTLREHGKPVGWSRSYANRSLARIKHVLLWAEKHGHLPEGKYHHLTDCVKGLEMDQHGARETDDVPPVSEDLLQAVLPHLNYVVRAVVDLLLLTAARPSEILNLRPCDIDRQGRVELARGYWVTLGENVWAVKLLRHKTAKKKVKRVLLFGPKAQAVLQPFLDRDPNAYLFSAAEAMAWVQAQRRKPGTPAPAVVRRRSNTRYTRYALKRSIMLACRRAFPLPQDMGPQQGETRREWWKRLTTDQKNSCRLWWHEHGFHPYQLRHNAATRIVAEFGRDVARIVLGHTNERMTMHYAVDDFQKAADAQGRAG